MLCYLLDSEVSQVAGGEGVTPEGECTCHSARYACYVYTLYRVLLPLLEGRRGKCCTVHAVGSSRKEQKEVIKECSIKHFDGVRSSLHLSSLSSQQHSFENVRCQHDATKVIILRGYSTVGGGNY